MKVQIGIIGNKNYKIMIDIEKITGCVRNILMIVNLIV